MIYTNEEVKAVATEMYPGWTFIECSPTSVDDGEYFVTMESLGMKRTSCISVPNRKVIWGQG